MFGKIKYNAKLAIRGLWSKAITIVVISLACTFVFACFESLLLNALELDTGFHIDDRIFVNPKAFLSSFINPISLIISIVVSLLSFMVNSPLELGVTAWYCSLMNSEKKNVEYVFTFFESGKKFFKSIFLSINLYIRYWIWQVIFLIPSFILSTISMIMLIDEPNSDYRFVISLAGVFLIVSGILFILCEVFYLIFINRYFLAQYIVCYDESISVSKAIKMSVRYTKGHRGMLFTFSLSFLLWLLSCMFIFPIFYVIPYVSASSALMAKYLIETNTNLDSNKNENTHIPESDIRNFQQNSASTFIPPIEIVQASSPEHPLNNAADMTEDTQAFESEKSVDNAVKTDDPDLWTRP